MTWHSVRDSALDRFGWLLSILIVAGTTWTLVRGQTLLDSPIFDPMHRPTIVSAMDVESALSLFAVRSQWLGSAILFSSAVVAALAFACLNFVRTFTFQELWRTGVLVGALVAVCWFAIKAASGMECCQHEPPVLGFVSRLLSSLKELEAPSRCDVHREVMATRFLGEGAGLALSLSLVSLAAFGRTPTSQELAARFRALRIGLYLGSFLFVAGVVQSQANFTWIFALWGPQTKEIAAAQSAVITAGLVQAGAAYSALLLATVAPTRWLLDWKLARATTRGERENWRAAHGVPITWLDELRQVAAILAPLLSAPVFDALIKA